MNEAMHITLLQLLLQASLWLAASVVLLALVRPLLLRLGGASLAYRSWWLLPLVLLTPYLPLPPLPLGDVLPVGGLVALPGVTAQDMTGPPGWHVLLAWAWLAGLMLSVRRGWRAQQRFEQGMGSLQSRGDGSWQASADPGLPALVGLWRPRIVVGPGFDAQFGPVERELVLRHERNHRRHGDPWANALLMLVRCVFWFHPLLPWAARRFLRDQELACDARTVGADPALVRPYAAALLKAQGIAVVVPMACHWRRPSLLEERITMLVQPKRKRLQRWSGQMMVVALCAAAGGAAWASQESRAPTGAIQLVMPGDRDAQVVKMPPPRYPKHAVDNRLTGEVVLRVDIDADGDLGKVRVLKASNPGIFEDVSIAAARQWTYQAAIRDGRPVASALRIPITFAMDEPEPTP